MKIYFALFIISFLVTVSLPAAECSDSSTVYKDGVYEGSARQGIFLVRLQVVIEAGRITDINYLELPDWELDRIEKPMRRKIIRAQSGEVDGVTGATVSCDLISAAVEVALNRARAGPDRQTGADAGK